MFTTSRSLENEGATGVPKEEVKGDVLGTLKKAFKNWLSDLSRKYANKKTHPSGLNSAFVT